ncbi:hypothetical protein C8255_16870 [filamentous cyanobacterium CCP3]|nr:hypothetical protein C8255_16870 [filamentous cyanobacterium CCP3]
MTELLQRAITEVSKLSDEEQDAIATRLLAELEDEQAWQSRFDTTTDDQWNNLAALVRQKNVQGNFSSIKNTSIGIMAPN